MTGGRYGREPGDERAGGSGREGGGGGTPGPDRTAHAQRAVQARDVPARCSRPTAGMPAGAGACSAFGQGGGARMRRVGTKIMASLCSCRRGSNSAQYRVADWNKVSRASTAFRKGQQRVSLKTNDLCSKRLHLQSRIVHCLFRSV